MHVSPEQVDAYDSAIMSGKSRVPAAKFALGLDIDKPPTLSENDAIQLIIETSEARAIAVNTAVISHDPVNHPSHYTSYKGIEVIQLVEQMNFNRGNAVKYLARAGKKPGGNELEDLRKARWYLNREIERMESDADA